MENQFRSRSVNIKLGFDGVDVQSFDVANQALSHRVKPKPRWSFNSWFEI